VNAASATVIVVLLVQVAEASSVALVAGGTVAFVAVCRSLVPLQRHTLRLLRDTTPRFPTPPEAP
jgi:hypothetical protein